MKSLWNPADATAAIDHWGRQGASADLALRTYSARLLGADPALVLHGGGNTSVKTREVDLLGDEVEVLRVKGSGWDLAAIEPAGHPAVRLAPLLRLRALDRLSDEAMVNAQRQNLLDSTAPNPSVETLLHAFIAQKFVDHTHSSAVLALADQAEAEAVLHDVYGDRVALVPYVMPGFALAKAAADAFDSRPGLEGLILLRHGVFSFGATAQEAYERMIALVSRAERRIAAAVRRPRGRLPTRRSGSEALPRLRGALAAAARGGAPPFWILDVRRSETALAFAAHPDVVELSRRGVATPDHVIRTKRFPVVLPGLEAPDWRTGADEALAAYIADYEAYFQRQAAQAAEPKVALDPLPRVAVIPDLGLIGLGRTRAEAAVNADLAESWAGTVLDAEAVGRFESIGEVDTFAMEYWSLEQAKLGKAARRPLEGRIVVITGGAGAIGEATARTFARAGAEVAVLDIDAAGAERAAKGAGSGVAAQACDVTDGKSVEGAFAAICERFGGVDIVVSNAGVALTGAMAVLEDQTLRQSFELNFFAHQTVAQAAVRRFRAQGSGGVLLFNVSKQAVNPGPDFGAYGTSKSALLALVRQYALELGAEGIRVNAVNPDRIRSGLLTDVMIAERARARGVSEADYMGGNLLRAEVLAQDVAEAFLVLAQLNKTTGAVIPVDGGNIAAMLR
jgi:rhamnose utilization protein RhaD (predicted bifunctional aldolase and dehydrogenase)/NAD(P)-dependent dehydrogenase (short-subunit alcohol dehydrogenase family)